MSAQPNVARADAITAIRFTLRLLTLVCLLTFVTFVWFSWIIFERLRIDRRLDLLSIIGALAVGGTSFIAWFQSLGVKNFLTKPYDVPKLLGTVHDALEVCV